MASRRASGTRRGDPVTAELDGPVAPQGDGPKHVQVVGQPDGAQAAFWPTRVYPRIAHPSQRVSTRRWIGLLVVLDVLIATFSVGVATLAVFGATPERLSERLPYLGLAATFPILWGVAMLLSGSYDRRYLAAGRRHADSPADAAPAARRSAQRHRRQSAGRAIVLFPG